MKRPKIRIELDRNDMTLEVLGVIGLVLLLALPFIYFESLPDSIPKHFGPDGVPDSFSGKRFIWVGPIIGVVMYVGMYWLNKYPHKFNHPHKITKENAEVNYRTSTKMIRALNVLIVYVFAYLTWATIQTGMGNQKGIGSWFTPVFCILIFGIIGYYLFKMQTGLGKK